MAVFRLNSRAVPSAAAVFLFFLAVPGAGSAPPGSSLEKEVRRSIDRGISFLLRRQNPNGSWGSAHNTKSLNIFAPVPGAHHAFRAAVTSLCIMALIEAGGDRPGVAEALERAEKWLFRRLPRLRRATPAALYNVWGHAYGIEALVELGRREPHDPERRERIKRLIEGQVELLERYECVGGGWAYYDFNAHTKKPSGDAPSFVVATVLIALREARDFGARVPEKLIQRGVKALSRQKLPDFSYLYSEHLWWRPRRLVNRPPGSLGRSQACNLALRMWGDRTVTDSVLTRWLRRLFDRNGWLSIGRKRPIPHESWFQVAGYFYYYGHYYAARCIEELPSPQRPGPASRLARVLLKLQEKDGSWWDYPLYDYHQQYGTAFALMALQRCLDSLAASS